MKIEEVGCWNCALDGAKSGKTICQDCGREVAHYCGAYSHEKISYCMDAITKTIQRRKEVNMKSLIHKIKIKLGLYDLRKEGAKWVAKNIGEEYVEEFLADYDAINKGIPIGGIAETIGFLNLIERIKKQI